MLFFYRYKKKSTKRYYKKAKRSMQYMESYGKWYFLLKFCRRNTALVPTITSWSWRSFYLHKRHFNTRELIKKSLLLHLFWVFDVWKVNPALALQGVATNYPISFSTTINNNDNALELYSLIHKWKFKYGLNKERLFPYYITKVWSKYKSENWMARPYLHFVDWRRQNTKLFLRNRPWLAYLNKWFLDNRYFHSIQARLRCHIPFNFPTKYTRTLWLRLLQYPALYDYNWLFLLVELSRYGLKKPLPWQLVYLSKDTWTFDRRAKALEKLLFALTRQRISITEYILLKHWRNLLRNTDKLSRMVQIHIRESSLFIKYKRRKKLVATY